MPSSLKRLHQSGQSHFITFTCYHRLPHLTDERNCELSVFALERARRDYQFRVYGFVLMPEHVHLLMSEPEDGSVATAIQSMKLSSSMRREAKGPLWQKRYYDRNVRDYDEFVEKLQYLHRNPVKRGLVACAEEWRWSSFRHYATGEECGVEIESRWTAERRKLEE